MTGPEILWGFGGALTVEGSMPAAFAQHLGAGKGFLGTWFLVGSLSVASAMLVTGWYVPSLAKKRGLVSWGHFVAGSAYLPVGLLARWTLPWGGCWAEVASLMGFGLFMLALGFLMPAWLALIGELFPAGQRGRVLGLVFVVNRVGGILGGLVAERLLRLPWSGTDVWTLLWGLAAASCALGSLPLCAVVEPDVERHPRRPFGSYMRGVFGSLADLPALRRFIGIDLLGVTAWVTLGLYGDAALRGKGLDVHWSGIWGATAAATQLLGAFLITWRAPSLAPRYGLAVGAASAAAASVVAAVADTPYLFCLVAAFLGFWQVSRQTCQTPLVMSLAPDREPTLPLCMAMASTSLVQGLLPLGADLLQVHTGFPPLFLSVAGMATLSAVFLFRTREPLDRGQRPR